MDEIATVVLGSFAMPKCFFCCVRGGLVLYLFSGLDLFKGAKNGDDRFYRRW